MKKLSLLSVIFVLLATLTINFVNLNEEEEAVKGVIVTGYVHGAFNELNPEAMALSFHKDFAIFSPGQDGEISRYPIANWISSTKRTKESSDFDASNNVWEHKFTSVTVSGNAASVQIELYKDGNHVYTDFLSLLKFEDDWKIVAKVYNQH